MSNVIWKNFNEISEIFAQDRFSEAAPKVDGMLNGIMETISMVLPAAGAPLLLEGMEAAGKAFTTVRQHRPVDRMSADFVAGRLASAVDILSFAASSVADEEAVEKARQQPYARILDELYKLPLRNVDLSRQLNIDKGQMSRQLSELREMQMVSAHHRGREVFNALTPIGRLVVEEGIERRNREPLSASNVLSGKRFTLAGRNAPSQVNASTPPMIKAC